MNIAFTPDEVTYFQDIALNNEHSFVRRKALVLLLKSQQVSHNLIVKIVGICENTLRSYLESYVQKGKDWVCLLNFRKPKSALKAHENEIRNYLEKTPPASIKQACYEIKQLTGISLKETQMRAFLKSLGARFRKVAAIPAKADAEKQKEFVDAELKPRLDEASEGNRKVYFVDGAHFVLGAFLGNLWSISRLFVKTPSGRQRHNVLGALDASTNELTTITNQTYITSTQVCELLKMIKEKESNKSDPKPITIVLDNARYQRCKAVIDYAESLEIELLFLPPYSPNLNLIERVWKFTKKHCLNSKYYPNFALFKEAINTFLGNMHNTHTEDLKSLLTHKFQTFKNIQMCASA